MAQESDRSVLGSVITAFLFNALIGFLGGWVLTGSSDPKRLSFSILLALTLGLLAASSAWRRRMGRWQSVQADIVSAAIVVAVMAPVAKIIGSLLNS